MRYPSFSLTFGLEEHCGLQHMEGEPKHSLGVSLSSGRNQGLGLLRQLQFFRKNTERSENTEKELQKPLRWFF